MGVRQLRANIKSQPRSVGKLVVGFYSGELINLVSVRITDSNRRKKRLADESYMYQTHLFSHNYQLDICRVDASHSGKTEFLLESLKC